MIDISMAGAKIILTHTDGSKLVINEFTDDGNPVEVPDFDIADGNMNLNGILVTWTKAQAVEFNISLIPNSASDIILGNYLRSRAIGGKGEIPEAFISSMVLCVPSAIGVSATDQKGTRFFTFRNGRLRRGSPALGSNAEGKIQARTYNFIFERVDAN